MGVASMVTYVCWRNGRNFVAKWHVAIRAKGTRMLCGAEVPANALVNRTHLVPESEVCHGCREKMRPTLRVA